MTVSKVHRISVEFVDVDGHDDLRSWLESVVEAVCAAINDEGGWNLEAHHEDAYTPRGRGGSGFITFNPTHSISGANYTITTDSNTA